MRLQQKIHTLYRFLPVQLLLLHFRKYQALLLFWYIVVAAFTGNFASTFGAAALFCAPEYFDRISFASMLILGGAMAVFVMAWHITTFIIHSKRMPFIGATRQAFLKYCINNSLLPLAGLVVYSVASVRWQLYREHLSVPAIVLLQIGFYLGFLFIVFLSFFYFFRVGRDLLKTVLARIAAPSPIREIIPYDTLDFEFDMIRADTYLCEDLTVEHIKDLEQYHPRLLNTILRRHHRNAIAATIFALLTLLLLGIFMEHPFMRIPAGAGFLMLFSVMMGILGAVKYFLRSWEIIGWLLFIVLFSWLAKHGIFDVRSIAYGMNYKTAVAARPELSYSSLRKIFTPQRYEQDKQHGKATLNNWKASLVTDSLAKPPLIVISVSGGGLRSAYWTFNTLQYLDSITKGGLYKHTVLLTGASGGMIGAGYWRAVHDAHAQGKIANPYERRFAENTGKDLLNAVVFSLAAVDMISPFNKISVDGNSYNKDRGYALEQELVAHSEGLLDTRIGDYAAREHAGLTPTVVYNSTVVNDGRRLMISSQPLSYLTQPAYALTDSINSPIDAIDFGTFFSGQSPMELRTTTALRMNATFPVILPVVKLPARPMMNVMDAGLRDNFGIELATRWLHVFRDWINENAGQVIVLQIRDTRENEVFPITEQRSLGAMLSQPVFALEYKWEVFQSYYHSYLRDYAPHFLDSSLKCLTFQYIPKKEDEHAALNFHLTRSEKENILQSIDRPEHTAAARWLVKALSTE